METSETEVENTRTWKHSPFSRKLCRREWILHACLHHQRLSPDSAQSPPKSPWRCSSRKQASRIEQKRCHIAKGILRKKNKCGDTKILHFMLYYREIIKKDNTGLVPNNTHTGSNRMATLQLNSQQPAFKTKMIKMNIGEKLAFPQMVLMKLDGGRRKWM